MGVAMLPRLAAMVSSTTTFRTRSSSPIMRNTRMVKGTKVMSVTSLVITMLHPKHRSTMVTESLRRLPALFNRDCPRKSNTPRLLNPATMIIRLNSRARVR